MAGYGYVSPSGFTILGWFKRTTIPPSGGEREYLITQYSQSPHNWSTVTQNNGLQFSVGYTSDSKLHISAQVEKTGANVLDWVSADARPEINDGNWHFFCLRLATDSKTFDFWIDDELLTVHASGSDPGTPAVASTAVAWSPGALVFGGGFAVQDGNFGHNMWTGSLAYIAVFTVPLSDDRVNVYYTSGSDGLVYSGDSEVKRLDRILDWADVPENARVYDPPLTTLQGIQPGQGAMDAVNDTAGSASGLVFADGQSRIAYHNRKHRDNRFNFVTFAESLGSAVNVGMEFSTDDTQVYNDITGSRPNGVTLRIQDQDSQGYYGRRTYSIEANINSDVELRNFCSWILSRYSSDRVRVQMCYLQAESSDLIQYAAECIQIGDVVTFDELTPNNPGTTLTYTVDAIGVEADCKAPSWQLQLGLTPNDLNYTFQVGTGTVGDGAYVAF